jgi:hypothetical protein
MACPSLGTADNADLRRYGEYRQIAGKEGWVRKSEETKE